MTFLQSIKGLGFRKVPWDKCPRGFQDSNYQCFYNKAKNIWVEIYLTDRPPYSQVQSNKTGYLGEFFYEPDQLQSYLQKHLNP